MPKSAIRNPLDCKFKHSASGLGDFIQLLTKNLTEFNSIQFKLTSDYLSGRHHFRNPKRPEILK